MIYFLLPQKDQATWSQPYAGAYWVELNKIGVKTAIITVEERAKVLPTLTNKDILFLQHFRDVQDPMVKASKAKTMYQINGTASGLFEVAVRMKQEIEDLKAIDYHLVFSEGLKKVVANFYKKTPGLKNLEKRIIVAGFPVDLADYMLRKGKDGLEYVRDPKAPVTLKKLFHVKRDKKKIVIAGKLDQGKQFYTSVLMLRPLVKSGYKVMFCYQDNDRNNRLAEEYELERFEKEGFIFKKCNKKQVWNELASASFLFSASLADTASVTLAEAVLLGVTPIFPDYGPGAMPNFRDYIKPTYIAYHPAVVEHMIKERINVSVDMRLFSPTECAQRLVKGLKHVV